MQYRVLDRQVPYYESGGIDPGNIHIKADYPGMNFSKIAGDISEIDGDPAISEQSVKKVIIPCIIPA